MYRRLASTWSSTRPGWHDPQARINVLNDPKDENGDIDESEKQAGVLYVSDLEHKRTNEADPFFFRAASGECVTYYHTNRTPKDLHRDDFQVKTPTDIIGQHIHLVKFDVTSSDGSANGWNYEDGTLAPDAVLERKCAGNAWARARGEPEPFEIGAVPPAPTKMTTPKRCGRRLLEHDELLQTTTQRWFADPILTVGRSEGEGADQNAWWMGHGDGHEHENTKDRTLRTVFTHDHFAPSSIQQHGFYSALLIEPAGSEWLYADGTPIARAGDGLGSHHPAPPPETPPINDHREFALAVADFALLYDPRHDPDDPETKGDG